MRSARGRALRTPLNRYHREMLRAGVIFATMIAFAACGTYGSEDAPAPNEDAGVPLDAGVDATDAAIAPDDGFVLTVAPEHVVVDPGDTIVSIQVSLTRGKDFAGAVDVKLNQLPAMAGVTSVNPLVIEGEATSGPIAFAISSAATPGDYPIEVRGESGTKSSKASFTLHVGSFLAAADIKETNVPLPAWVTKIDIAMWGGGGGGGHYDTSGSGGSGGAGGFTSARVTVTGGTDVVLSPAKGGGTTASFKGGGGGGYSSISQGATLLAIAGGGGGGGVGSNGSAHGGAPGNSPNGKLVCQRGGNGGAMVGGGAGGSGLGDGVAGAALTGGGGDASASNALGGAKGGGNSFDKAGGGGGGWFGGGSGGTCMSTIGGGGAGSAFAIAGAENVVIEYGVGTTPPKTTHPDYGPNPSTAIGGIGDTYQGAALKPGGPGRIVIRLAK